MLLPFFPLRPLLRLQIIVCYVVVEVGYCCTVHIHRYSDLRVFWNLAVAEPSGVVGESLATLLATVIFLNLLQPTNPSQALAYVDGCSP